MIALIASLVLGPTFTPDPGLPTIPPPLPTYIVNDDGTRTTCSPNFTTCDWN
ncbi:hypothetical protein SEA_SCOOBYDOOBYDOO_9 [Mycobacterium phage ScoobyDoobyDoo]|nr:hypothetical protein SEA_SCOOBYDOOBYDOO_9 [Mycobacterium phage ScoobyDoobyDoo]